MAALVVVDLDGSPSASWNLSLTPRPTSYSDGESSVIPVTGATGDLVGVTLVTWHSADAGGAAPVFVPGIYGEDGDDTITIGSAPETATWAMMLVGLGVIGFAARRRLKVGFAF